MTSIRELFIEELMKLTSLDRRTLDTMSTENLVELLKKIKGIE